MLYFVPQQRANEAAVDVKSLNLEYAFEGPITKAPTMKGLGDHGQGTLLCQDGACQPGKLYLDEANQTWQEFEGVWIGYWNESKPGEQQLRRKEILYGETVDMAGEPWIVPKARQWDEIDGNVMSTINLKRYIQLSKDSQPVYGRVVEQYQPLADIALEYLANLTETEDIEAAKLVENAGLIMSFNYRIGIREMSVLEMMDGGTPSAIMEALIDFGTFVELQKKRVSSDINTPVGEQVADPVTSQQ